MNVIPLTQRRAQRAQKPRASATSVPAPIGGWNARDSLGDMPITDAVTLQNWWPATSDVWLRAGMTEFATVASGDIETLMVYNALSGDNKCFAASTDNNIYDVTLGGAGVAVSLPAAITSARWQYTNFGTSTGQFLYCVNGEDTPVYYDGSAWANPTITGVTAANLININIFQNRLWFVEKGTLSAWYLGADAIQGAATEFPLQGVFKQGGYLMAMATWTIDAGYGVDDLAAFISSTGEVAVYRLSDPTDYTSIQLVGVWSLGSPIGRRCYLKYAGDLLIICQDGILPMSAALQSSRLNPKVSITDKIQFAMSQAISSYGQNFGWQLLYFPKENQLYLNVPVQEGSNQQQYVMNTITKNWSNFTGWEANCWELFEDQPVFGAGSTVYEAWDGLSDDGNNIEGFALQAFSTFGNPNLQKRFTLIRPTLFTNGIPALLGEINVDFDLSDTTSPLSFNPIVYGVWDSGVWDSAVWGTDMVSANGWQGVTGIGYYGAVMLKTATNSIQTRWVNTTVVWENGSIL